MIKEVIVTCLVQLLLACLVVSQSCPSNIGMGLCEPVPKPCFGDNDCSNGEMCCPESCSRSCKPRLSRPVSRDTSAPDLLNDPRVYIGKCPDSSCYNMFGGEPNECSTSKLCPRGKLCCNDGCKNVCQWTPEYVALIAGEEARAKTHQRMIIQRQQEELRRRQQEMYELHQRQLATAELARKQSEARAAAEGELAAQQARAKYDANLRAVAVAQSKAVSVLQQRMAQQRQQLYSQQNQPAASISGGTFVDNFIGEPSIVNSISSGNNRDQLTPQQGQTTPSFSHKLNGYFSAMKNEQPVEPHVSQINSPANANPYNSEFQQRVKDRQNELLSLIQSPASHTSAREKEIFPEYSRLVASNQEVLPQSRVQHYSQNLPSTYQEQSLAPTYQARQSLPFSYVQQYRLGQPSQAHAYQSVGYADSPTAYYEHQGQGAVHPLLMYHAMQTAA